MLQTGDILDKTYQLMQQIGSGGTGVIYKAYHLRLKKYVVVKKIKDHFAGSINGRAEVDILKQLHHTYLPQVYDFLQIEGQIYTIMDYIDGFDLKYYADSGTVFSEKQLICWLHQLLEVLGYLHGQKPPIIHCDIKPANIMLTPDGSVCLIDFNISLEGSENDDIQGVTKAFAAPEQIQKMELASKGYTHSHIKVDEKSDLYSLGRTIMFLMLCGNGSYTNGLWKIIEKAAQEERKDRYVSVSAMKRALDNIRKEDKLYIRFRNISMAGYLAIAVIALLSMLGMYYGYYTMAGEEFRKEMTEIESYSKEGGQGALIENGIRILNTKKYQKQLKKSPKEKAWLLHKIGDGYFFEESYASAAEYYEEASAVSKSSRDYTNKEQYDRDCAIGYAKAGEADKALKILEDGQDDGMNSSTVLLVKGEINAAKGENEAALEELQEAFAAAADSDVKERAAIGIAELYKKEGSMKKGIPYLQEAHEAAGSRVILRKLGEAYNADRKYSQALACYQELYQEKGAIFEDRINYALSLELVKKYKESMEVLKSVAADYPEDFRPFMYMARIAYTTAHAEKNPDYKEAIRYFNKSKQCYAKAAQDGETDEQMEELIQVMKGVDQNGKADSDNRGSDVGD